tara:strand:+ start:744 stop:980 length:237 start_codon:yes stop_codon:yes gene_type:complete
MKVKEYKKIMSKLKTKRRRKLHTIIEIPTYQKYWVYAKPYGHDIVIAADTGKYTIKCMWAELSRDIITGRVNRINDKR